MAEKRGERRGREFHGCWSVWQCRRIEHVCIDLRAAAGREWSHGGCWRRGNLQRKFPEEVAEVGIKSEQEDYVLKQDTFPLRQGKTQGSMKVEKRTVSCVKALVFKDLSKGTFALQY